MADTAAREVAAELDEPAFGEVAGFDTASAGFVMDDERLSDELKRLNSEVRAAAERGANLTRQLLTFARRESDNPRVIGFDETIRGHLFEARRDSKRLARLVARSLGQANASGPKPRPETKVFQASGGSAPPVARS